MRRSKTSALWVCGHVVALAIAAPSLSCAERVEPGILLVVTADPEVRARAEAVRLHVEGGAAPAATELSETRGVADGKWPLRVVIRPRDGDTTRALQIELQALDGRQRSVAELRAMPHFEARRMRVVALHFEARCLDVACARSETCDDGRCVAIPMPPDAGVATGDAGAPVERADAGMSAPTDACAAVVVYVDRDGDGFGDPASAMTTCAPSSGSVTRAGDCDDACAGCHPGASEICEGARDENCDGDVDERCDCTVGETRTCEGGDDVCVPGVQTCAGGRWGACVGRIEAQDETCNAADDDCDGRIDERVERDCPGGSHRCRATCVVGVWGVCRDRDGDLCGDDD